MGIRLNDPSDHDHDKAFDIFDRVTEWAGRGTHTLTLAVTTDEGTATMKFPFVQDEEGMECSLHDLYDFTGLLAVAASGVHPGGMSMRTMGDPDTVRGWQFTDGDPLPLTGGQTFNFYATDILTGEIRIPLPDTEFSDAPVIHV
ncbi:hypothetical protein [Streptomyces californicus]